MENSHPGSYCGQDAYSDMLKNDYCIGNGQVHQLYLSRKVGALNCLQDQQKVLRGGVMKWTFLRFVG